MGSGVGETCSKIRVRINGPKGVSVPRRALADGNCDCDSGVKDVGEERILGTGSDEGPEVSEKEAEQ